MRSTADPPTTQTTEFLVVGAGVCGSTSSSACASSERMCTVLEADDDLGGTWYQNRYPGCRFDSESYTYGYSFSTELLDEWHWREHFSGKPRPRATSTTSPTASTCAYIAVRRAVVGADSTRARTTGRFISKAAGRSVPLPVTALGPLSVPTMPRPRGHRRFDGPSFHTFDWPHEPIDLAGKRVAVIGTGATGVQVISACSPRSAS